MLLDSFEEELHLPAILVERGDGQQWLTGSVGKKHQGQARLGFLNRMRRKCSG